MMEGELLLTSYRCSKCGVGVAVAVSVRRVACWRCRRRMQTVKEPVVKPA